MKNSKHMSKDDYILRSLSKIQHKKWELYVITRIIHSLNDPEIKFVCQQLIKTKNNKRSLTDLCFPGLKLYYEIDEGQHKKNIEEDQDRQKEIIDAVDFKEKRILVYDKNLEDDKNLEEINKEIEEIVDTIKQEKKKLGKKFKPWNYEEEFSSKPHIEKEHIDVKDNVVFLYHRDALQCFGYNKEGNLRNSTWKTNDINKEVWFPKLYENKDWKNSLSDDEKK